MICRFANEDDLQKFNTINGLHLTKNTTAYNFHTKETKEKRKVVPKARDGYEPWKEHWVGMPEYVSNKQQVYAKIEFTINDVELANKIFNQKITPKTKSIWFPWKDNTIRSQKRFIGGDSRTNYPIYVVSKGRADKCSTSKWLTRMEVKHYVVVEPDELLDYIKYVENEYASVLELDMSYKDNYDTFDDLGDSKPKGPGGARNFAWEHSKGYKWHWVFDDNASEGFHYMYHNEKIKLLSGAFFRAIEDFVNRYKNIAIAGLNYSKFCKSSDKTPAFVLNTRIYSFLLIRNDIPYRWRGRYNEDTDLSLRALKDGWCTIQFNALLGGKNTTQRSKGGNTDEFYADEGTLPKSQMLADMHPDVAKVVWKFNRWHHQVDYSGFTQQLELLHPYSGDRINMYEMYCVDTEETNMSASKSQLENKYGIEGGI